MQIKGKLNELMIVKSSNDSAFPLDIAAESTVLELKIAICDHLNQETSPGDQRLIFAGKVLKDEELLSLYKLQEGNTIHLVRGGKKAAPAPAMPQTSVEAAPAIPAVPPMGAVGAGGLQGLMGMMGQGMGQGGMPQMPQGMPSMNEMIGNPMMMSQMMADPAMLASNPQLANMISPEIRQQMASPQMQAILSNPAMMQQMLQMQGGMGGVGAGLNPLNNMYGQQPAMNPFMQQMLNNPATGGQPSAPTQSPEEMYSTQLQQLQDMGFYSAQENVRALRMSGGNVEGAVEILFSNPTGTLQ